jgi:hypothetical protein
MLAFPLVWLWPHPASLLVLLIGLATVKRPYAFRTHRQSYRDSTDDHDDDDYCPEIKQVTMEEGIHLTLLRQKDSDKGSLARWSLLPMAQGFERASDEDGNALTLPRRT